LPVTHLLKEGSIVFDVGSGAGLPGVVIAMARPDLHVTLIEPLERRVEFLKEAVEGLDIEVFRGQAQDLRSTAHYVTARAVAPLEKLKRITWHLLKTGGSLMAIKGKSAEDEMKSVAKSILHEVALDGIELGRIVEVHKGA
jgi:16S rRNA (guanine527-N7)-methyltransferase